MKQLLLSIFSLLFIQFSFAQNNEKYAELVKEAWSLYQTKEFQQSAEKYKEAFDQLEGKAYPNDRYNAACSYALATDVENAFFHLFRLAESRVKYKNYAHISIDPDLEILHKDERWEKLLTIVKANK